MALLMPTICRADVADGAEILVADLMGSMTASAQAQPTSDLPPAEAIKRCQQHQPAGLVLLRQQVPDADAAS